MQDLINLLLAPFQGKAVFFAIFNGFVLVMLALDLGLAQKKEHEPTMKEAAAWTGLWVGLALAFFGGLMFFGHHMDFNRPEKDVALEFLAGYLIEQSLSVDNLFVFLLIFNYFRVPRVYQRHILFYGILGALILRAIMILAGAALVEQFHWVLYIFGAFLVYTGVKIALPKEEDFDPNDSPVMKLVNRCFRVTEKPEGKKFWLRRDGKLFVTPLFLVLVVVETTDVVFAVDSIPAVFGVSKDPFVVYTSNVFAIMGLRSLFFLIQGVMSKFHYLNLGLAVVLTFVGVKMLIAEWVKVPVSVSLGVIVSALGLAAGASMVRERRMASERTE